MTNAREFIPVNIAVLTVSDTRSVEQDKSGQVLVDRLIAAGQILADRTMLHDERAEIAKQLRKWVADPQAVKPDTTMPKLPMSDQELNDILEFLGGI